MKTFFAAKIPGVHPVVRHQPKSADVALEGLNSETFWL